MQKNSSEVVIALYMQNGYRMVLLLEKHQKNKIVTKIETVTYVNSSISPGCDEIYVEKPVYVSVHPIVC